MTARNGTTAMLWPVYSYAGQPETIAWFFDYWAAMDFVNANLGARNLYIGESVYDHLSREAEQLTDIEHLGPGRIAA